MVELLFFYGIYLINSLTQYGNWKTIHMNTVLVLMNLNKFMKKILSVHEKKIALRISQSKT